MEHTTNGATRVGPAGRPLPVRHELQVQVDADPFWLSPLRALVTELAARADFDLDAVADLTLAVDEACAALIKVADPGEPLVGRVQVAADRVTVSVSLTPRAGAGGRTVHTESFGWRVLCTLADQVELTQEGGGIALAIRLTKHATM